MVRARNVIWGGNDYATEKSADYTSLLNEEERHWAVDNGGAPRRTRRRLRGGRGADPGFARHDSSHTTRLISYDERMLQ